MKARNSAVDIGIIGGADGPTNIFITSAVTPAVITAAAVLAAAVVALVIVIAVLIKRKKKK